MKKKMVCAGVPVVVQSKPLTPEQKAKADEALKKFREKFTS
jgi:hypothetical protein